MTARRSNSNGSNNNDMTKPDISRLPALSIEQENAIDLLIQGKTDGETAVAVGVSRQTVNEWRNHNADFIAALNDRRQDLWGAQTEKLRALLGSAVDVLQEGLQSDDARLRQAAAVHILRAVGLYGAMPPGGPVTPDEVEQERRAHAIKHHTDDLMAMAYGL